MGVDAREISERDHASGHLLINTDFTESILNLIFLQDFYRQAPCMPAAATLSCLLLIAAAAFQAAAVAPSRVENIRASK